MNFDSPLVVISLFVGGIFVLMGALMYFFPPKNINGLYGYRTASSMENQQRWDFAQKYSAKQMMLMGAVMAACCLLHFFVALKEMAEMWLGLAIMISLVVILIYRTEKAIKKKFGDF